MATSIYYQNLFYFGNEGLGISDALQKQVLTNIYIPQAGMIKSLNISVACAIILYEDWRQKLTNQPSQIEYLNNYQQETLRQNWINE